MKKSRGSHAPSGQEVTHHSEGSHGDHICAGQKVTRKSRTPTCDTVTSSVTRSHARSHGRSRETRFRRSESHAEVTQEVTRAPSPKGEGGGSRPSQVTHHG